MQKFRNRRCLIGAAVVSGHNLMQGKPLHWQSPSSAMTRKAARAIKPYPAPSRLPALIAFDLDATLWTPEMYELRGGAPFTRDAATGVVRDRRGEQMHLMGASRGILASLAGDPAWAGVKVAYVSRTEYPEWAVPCLQTFQLLEDGTTMFDLAERHGGPSMVQIYPGSKRLHFKNIQTNTGIPYQDMIFYDNEYRNIRDCSGLGITCIYTPDGMTDETWEEGLQQFAKCAGNS